MSLDDLILKVHHKDGTFSVKYSSVTTFADVRARLGQNTPWYRFRIQGADLFFQDKDLVSRAVRLGASFRNLKSGQRLQEFMLEDPSESGGALARRDLRPSGIKRVWKSGFLHLRIKTVEVSSRKRKEKKKQWTQYYFVYSGGSLFWFSDVRAYQMGREAVGCLPMGGLEPDLKDPVVDERANSFVLHIPASWDSPSCGKTLYLDCGGAQTKAEWVSAIMNGIIRRKVCTVAQVLPYIVAKFPKSMGIFRKAGHAEKIKLYMELIDQGMYPDYVSINEEHDLTGVMKRNLRSMPEPLLTQAKYKDFVKIGRIQDMKKRIAELREIIRSLPTMNRVFSRELFEGLNKISMFSEVSKMTSSNLAIVIGPNILRKDGLDAMSAVADNDSIVDIVTTLIEHWEEVFPGDEESEALASKVPDEIFGLSIASRNIDMGIPRLLVKKSISSEKNTKASPSFADRFKKRETGLYGIPSSSAIPSFTNSVPPSFPSGPSPPGPPPNVKAISRPSFRNSAQLKSFRQSIKASNAFSAGFLPLKEQNILTESKTVPSPSGSKKRKFKRRGLPKRPNDFKNPGSPPSTSKIKNTTRAINQNNATGRVERRKKVKADDTVSQTVDTNAKPSGPPKFNPKTISSQQKTRPISRKPGPPPVPTRKPPSKLINSEQSSTNSNRKKHPSPPSSVSKNSNSFKKPSPPGVLPVNTGASQAVVKDSLPFKKGHNDLPKSAPPLKPSSKPGPVGPPQVPVVTNNETRPGVGSQRDEKSKVRLEGPDHLSNSPLENKLSNPIGDEKDSETIRQRDDAIVKRCERVLEICRDFQRRQNGNNLIIDNLDRLKDMSKNFQQMLTTCTIPEDLTVKNLQAILKELDEQRQQYLEAIRKVNEFMCASLNSTNLISPSFYQDEEECKNKEDYEDEGVTEEDRPEASQNIVEDCILLMYAKFPYNGGVRKDSELIFEGGEIIELFEENAGWARGRIYMKSEEGWFPTSYVEELPKSYFEDDD